MSEEDFPKSQTWGIVEGNIGTRGFHEVSPRIHVKLPSLPPLKKTLLRFPIPQFIPILHIDVVGDVHT